MMPPSSIVVRAHASAVFGSASGRSCWSTASAAPPVFGSPQGRQTRDEVVIGIGVTRRDDHRGESGRVQSVGGIQHPQQVEGPHLVRPWFTAGQCGQHALGEAAVSSCRSRRQTGAVPADFRHQCRHLTNHPELLPLAFAGQIVVDGQLVAADRGKTGAQYAHGVGLRIERADQVHGVAAAASGSASGCSERPRNRRRHPPGGDR